jgi:hypothetical protein
MRKFADLEDVLTLSAGSLVLYSHEKSHLSVRKLAAKFINLLI